MGTESIFVDFDPRWIVHEDDALIAVNKPTGVSSQAADDARPDDIVTRLRAFLARRDGVRPRDVYLGIHQRLDKDTSGVLVYARRKEANASLAAQMEGRSAKKTYVAGVVMSTKLEGVRTLRHRLVRGDDGLMQIADARDRRAKEAISEVRLLRSAGDRGLLDVRIETGRTHQIRAQLAAEGMPVVGDPLYGEVPGPRLMLHAARLELRHPITEVPLRLEAPLPPSFARWVEQGDRSILGDAAALKERIEDALHARYWLGRSDLHGEAKTTSLRIVHGAGDGLPGIVADVYGEHLVVQLYGDEVDVHRDVILDAFASFGFAGIYLKVRPRQANTLVDTRREEVAPPHALCGADAPDPMIVFESGVPLEVRLGDGLSTGLFLDQRDNRRRVAALAEGARVLNLFAYTCAFSVAAARARAASTTNVDISAQALAWGERNFALNEIELGGRHRFLAADCFDALEGFARLGERFDLVVLDPPSYSTTRSTRFSAESDYRRLAAMVFACCAPRARVLACTNHRSMAKMKWRRYLHEGARDAGRVVAQMKDLALPMDFPVGAGEDPHMKSVLITLE